MWFDCVHQGWENLLLEFVLKHLCWTLLEGEAYCYIVGRLLLSSLVPRLDKPGNEASCCLSVCYS